MSVIAQERPAIERAITRWNALNSGKARRVRIDPVLEPVRLAGISRPGGVNSSLNDTVAVFVPTQDADVSKSIGVDLPVYDQVVLVRQATAEERAQSPLGLSALHVVELLIVRGIPGHKTLQRIGINEHFVAC